MRRGRSDDGSGRKPPGRRRRGERTEHAGFGVRSRNHGPHGPSSPASAALPAAAGAPSNTGTPSLHVSAPQRLHAGSFTAHAVRREESVSSASRPGKREASSHARLRSTMRFANAVQVIKRCARVVSVWSRSGMSSPLSGHRTSGAGSPESGVKRSGRVLVAHLSGPLGAVAGAPQLPPMKTPRRRPNDGG